VWGVIVFTCSAAIESPVAHTVKEFGKHLVKSACSFTAVSIALALALPLAACGGGSGDAATSQTAGATTGSAATSAPSAQIGSVTGTVNRSTVASTSAGTTGGTTTSKSTVGTAVTTAMAAATATTATAAVAKSAPAATTSTTTMATTTPATATATATSASASTAPAAVKPQPVTTPVTTPVSTPVKPPVTAPVTTPTPVVPANKKSISAWVSCGTAADDTTGAQQAFAAARQNAFTLVVDCPVHLKSGTAIDRGIFIDNGTSVEFTGAGKFYVDNLFHPAFVIANSSNITLMNWNVEWDGTVPINPDVGGYTYQGKFVTSAGQTQPAGAFNDLVLTAWLASNRKITFNETQGWVKAIWDGGVNASAVFYLTGDSSNVVFSGLSLSVPANAAGNAFLPMAVSFSQNWNSNQTVNGKTPYTVAYAMVPHGITFSGVTFDGILMGFQGNVRNAVFQNLTSHRYADLMDANGGTTGGIGKWFPPPHLFYLNYAYAGDPGLFNTDIQISNVQDLGPRLGVARDTSTSNGSGFANSLKLGCTECSVDGYISKRPDGFMDLLPSQDMTVSNVKATVDSNFINNLYPAGIRFPGTGYSQISYDNVSLTDTAESTVRALLGNASSTTNAGIVFSNFTVTMNRWAGSDLPVPTIAGKTNDVAVELVMSAQLIEVSYLQNGPVISTLEASPISLHPGSSTVLTWSSTDASSCSAGGAWSGALGTSGTKTVKVGAAGSSAFGLVCQSASVSANTSLLVSAQ
jgi:hypothetical protein